MSVTDRFRSALFSSDATAPMEPELLPERLAQACAESLSVAGVGISLINEGFRIPLGASDAKATSAERLQFTLGEGPCLAAYAQSHALRADESELRQSWPMLYAELVRITAYRSVVSLPMLRVQGGRGGAVDLYLVGPTQAGDLDLGEAEIVIALMAAALAVSATSANIAVAAGAGAGLGNDSRPLSSGTSDPRPAWLNALTVQQRQRVWVAIGILNVELEVNAADALALLRAFGFARGRVLDDIAEDLITGVLPAADLRT